jgi:hypothetical protein
MLFAVLADVRNYRKIVHRALISRPDCWSWLDATGNR